MIVRALRHTLAEPAFRPVQKSFLHWSTCMPVAYPSMDTRQDHSGVQYAEDG
jgi:hypothetical protein